MLRVDKIYCGDCLDLFPEVDDNSVDLVVTSPPYNLGVGYDVYVDEIPWPDYYRWSKKWMKEVYRVLKPDGRFCLNHYFSCGWVGHRSAPLQNLGCIAEDAGFKHHGVAVWDDKTLTKYTAWGSWLSASSCYINSPYEGILILYKDVWKKDHKGISTITKEEFIESCLGIWKLPTERCRDGCPAPFPVALPRRCINLFTYKGELVLDPFMGGGSTAMAAIETGRHFIGFEVSKKYCKIAEERIRQAS